MNLRNGIADAWRCRQSCGRALDPAPGYVGALATSLVSFRLSLGPRTFERAEERIERL
jgi:hypothetical protein